MSKRDELIGFIWDAYRDVHGIRPRWINFDDMSESELVDMCNQLEREVEASIKEEQARQAQSVIQFEAKVAELISIGAADRATALSWLRDAEGDASMDEDYFEYKYDLPYGYLQKAVA